MSELSELLQARWMHSNSSCEPPGLFLQICGDEAGEQ